MMKTWLFFFSLVLSPFSLANFQVEIITDQLNQPWGVAQLPDGRFLVTEKKGDIRIVDLQGSVSSPLVGGPDVDVVGQGGLMDVLVHPDFETNQWVYLSYASGNSIVGYGTEVARAVLNGNKLEQLEIIFTALPKVKGGRHFGSRLIIDENNYLFIGLGDRGKRQESQNLKSHIGSLIRLHDDGAVPKDNPFVNTKGAKPEIFSYGHRNIQGLTKDFESNVIWLHEHGPQGGDEVNRILKGKNYGWPTITYGAEYGSGFKIGEGTEKAGMEQPSYYWDPSIAPSGLAFFDGELWVGALRAQLISVLGIQNGKLINEQRYFKNEFGRVRDVKVFDGAIYVLAGSQNGKLIKIKKI
jgi:glucose/arabinose dehydrogenase